MSATRCVQTTRNAKRMEQHPRSARTRRLALAAGGVGIVGASIILGGCSGAAPNRALVQNLALGEHGQARRAIAADLSASAGDRNYLLERMRLGPVQLADGLPQGAERNFQEIYTVLDTKGLNKDKALAAVLLNEDLKIWKGEPFEQAMAWHYMAVRNGSVADWDNMRSAAASSLFLLADFGKNEKGERKSTEEIAKEAGKGGKEKYDEYLNTGYTNAESNFVLGYLLQGVASQAMVRTDEARECFARAVTFNPALRETAEVLQSGAYNTVLVVDYGQGPRKIGYGMDNALSKFVAWEGFASDGRPLNVRTDAGALSVPVAIDMNAMAADHMWNNLQDVRSAKSIFGTAALATGAVLATSGNRDAQLAGAIVAMVGLFAKAGAHADTRYCEAIPQRVYVVPLRLTGEGTTVELQVGDDQFSRMVLTGLGPPAAPEKVQVRYVRLNHGRVPAGWALSGRPVYRWCGVCPPVEGDGMPFILGGRCVAPPSEEAMSRYQRAGNLPGMLVSDLENLYRAEGITWRVEDEAGKTPLHVLEGGTSLVAPQAGTAGFARLFCQDHEPYKARSKELAETRARLGLR